MTQHEATPSLTPTPLLRPRALYIEVAEQLRQRIYNRDLEPGSWIDEVKMAQEFGISRTPLREAIKVLAAEGLVTMKVRRGAYVTEVSDQDLLHVYHLLSLLESDAAASVAQHANELGLAALEQLHTELTASVQDQQRFFVLNERFHMELLTLAGNRWSVQVVTDLRKVMKLSRQQSLFKTGRVHDSLAEHRTILDAVLARNPEAARAAMQTHFANGLIAAGAPKNP